MKAFWCLVFIPILEILALFFALWYGGSVWNLGHLLGMVCGVIAVLLLPTQITMKNRRPGGLAL